MVSADESKRRGIWPTLSKEQRTHIIISIWREGISASEIAAAIGSTKGAIVGHYYRYPPDMENTPLRPKVRRISAYADRNPIPLPEPTIAPYDPLYVSLVDNNGCSWPVNDGAPYLFCGHTRLGRYSYCSMHHKLSRGRGTDSERSAHRVSERYASS